MNFFIDLKRITNNQASTEKIGIGINLNYRIMKLNANFKHLNLKNIPVYYSTKIDLHFLHKANSFSKDNNVLKNNVYGSLVFKLKWDLIKQSF